MTMSALTRGLGLGFGLLVLSGCGTLTPDPAPASVREAGGVETDVKALQEWRQEVRLEQENQARDIEKLRKQVNDLESAFREQQQAMRVQIQDLEMAREQDKKFIIEELTRKLVGLQGAVSPPAPSNAAKTGYEHVVKSGETLTDIAKAYKVKPDAIIKANGLKNANSIRVGQKLFIPD